MSSLPARVGLGFDVHRFAAGRPLVVGGEPIPHELGLAGHSDADVLLHALCDALLGAAALGDIGTHFPDTEPAWKDASSLDLLRRTAGLVSRAGYRILQVDTVVVAERPKLARHYPAMRRNIAAALGIPEGDIGVKATTTEGLGFTGRGEGIAAQAVCLIAPVPRGEEPGG